MSRLGDRHSSDLDGRLQPGDPVRVAVLLGGADDAVADQHTAWMLVNLLARLEGVVEEVLVVGADVDLHPRVCPPATSSRFPVALVDAANAVEGVPVARAGNSAGAELVFHIGPGPAPQRGWRVVGHAWAGTLTTSGVDAPAAPSALPFGPYAAACLAAGEVFRSVCLLDYAPAAAVSLDLWDHTTTNDPTRASAGPLSLDVQLDFGLAGVGAVGVALLHVLWACAGVSGRGIIADDDPDGVHVTNLNRCVLFDRRHLGLPKASTAAAICAAMELHLHPVNGRYDPDTVTSTPRVLLSAVDGNPSRHALQQAFVPGIAFAASTQGLRAELVRFGPPGDGPCLACFNPIDDGIPDTVRRSAIRKLDAGALTAIAQKIGCDPERLRAWAASGDCGLISSEALGLLQAEEEPPAVFAVGFVSVIAGVMLATELIRDALAHDGAAAWQSVKFQFHRPGAKTNGLRRAQPRDPNCPICSDGIHVAIWRRRWAAAATCGDATAA